MQHDPSPPIVADIKGDHMSRMTGKVAFITGAARGQGRSHALRLAEEGADIIAVDICDQIATVGYPMSTEADLQETVEQVEKLDRRIVAKVADVRDPASLRRALDAGLAEVGRLDSVIANAGIMPTYGDSSTSMQSWQDTLDVLLTGVLNTVEATWPTLVEQGTGGSVVITSSMAALTPMVRTRKGHRVGLLAYSAAKAAVVNLARNYASMLAADYIRVNTVHPTGVNTPMVRNDLMDRYFTESDPEDLLSLVNAIPVPLVEARDISEAVLWLCSDESRYVTGTALPVDAGATLR
jgi:SDR family mycofactocin-dependent oxidoreductase